MTGPTPILVADERWTVDRYVDAVAEIASHKPAIVDRFGRMTWAEVADLSRRLASGLESRGVGPGDRVAVQLPNWRQFPLIEYALARLGAVCVPLPPIYRQRELRFMLGLTDPVLVIAPDSFRGFHHASMMEDLRVECPSVKDIVVVGDAVPNGCTAFDALLDAGRFAGPGRTDPDALTEIGFTSGTTGEPKGAMHSARSNFYPLRKLIPEQRLTASDVLLMASTFGHQTGFVYGGQLPAMLGGTVVLLDQWDAAEAARLIAREGVTWTMGATPFLQDLVEVAGTADLDSLRIFLCSGAAIPAPLLARARERLATVVTSGWGMTEVGLVTLSRLDDASERVSGSDGCALPGMEVRVLDQDGEAVEPDQEGDLACRGPSMFLGYYRRPEVTAKSFTPDGWFRTGDRARMDIGGYIRITGRSKDIIIRGGENIPVIEVEDLLHKHPAIDRVAIVAVPDPRLQERACAVAIPKPGQALTLGDMQRYLAECQIAKQYIPEHLIIVEAFPMTPSGKVQKFLLRTIVAEMLGRGRDADHAGVS